MERSSTVNCKGEKELPKVTYHNEITLMMRGFGDSLKPNPDTVHLVEKTVLNQLRAITREASKYSKDAKQMNGEELVFLMRKNRWQMRRFVKHLRARELRKALRSINVTKQDEDADSKKQHQHRLLEFIEKIDETGELMDVTEFDQVKHARETTANRISEALDTKRYLEFQKARCTSFTSGTFASSLEKLRQWIDPERRIELTDSAVEVLAYYAFETVAQIVDYVLLIRMDSKRFTGSRPDYSGICSGQAAISVSEVKEVLRRVYMPQVGRFNFGGKPSKLQFLFAL